MSICFDRLPDNIDSGFPVIPKGRYKVRIEKAEMRMPKDTTKPPYLSMTLKVFDANGNSLGNIFDMLTESESPYMGHKIKRFVTACGINLSNTFELRDLAKVVPNKEIMAYITVDDKDANNVRNQVDIFSDCYDPIDTMPVIQTNTPMTLESVPFEPDVLSDEFY